MCIPGTPKLHISNIIVNTSLLLSLYLTPGMA